MVLAKEPMKRIIRDNGASQVGQMAVEEFSKAVEDYANQLAITVVDMAKHAGRKTVNADDVRVAIKHFSE